MSVLGYLVLVVHLALCYKGLIAMENATNFVQITSCTCLGNIITYECTVMRGSGTIWNGSAFSCASSSNEIYLLENNYIESPDTGNPLNSVTCNNGMIMGRVIQIDKGSYTSQLNVTISSDLIGKNVSCARSFESTTEIIGSSDRINISAVAYPPQKPSLIFADLGLRRVSFAWSPVGSDCSAIHYNILASNCGSCPTTTKHTNVTCTDIPTDGSTCVFAVRTVVCGNITGNASDEARGIFKAATIINSGCTGTTVSASIFAVGLVISVTVFISIIIVVIKANKRARSIELATRRRTRLSRYEDQDPANQQPRRTIESECTTNASIYDDMDYEIAKVAIIATNKNIAYDNLAIEKTGSNIKEHEYAQIH